MSYQLHDAKGYVGDLASNAGLMEMVAFFNDSGGKLIKKFVKEGEAELSKEFKAELKALPDPDETDLREVIKNLILMIGKSKDKIFISDGVTGESSEKGGSGSGHYEHDARPGQRGGSVPYMGSMAYHRAGGAMGNKSRWKVLTIPDNFAIHKSSLPQGSTLEGQGFANSQGDYLDPDVEGYLSGPEYKKRRYLNLLKSGKKGGDSMGMIIQSILLPRGMSLDMLMTKKGLEFLADASQDQKEEFERYTKFEQMPVGKFDKESLEMVKIHESGAWIIGGKVLDEKSAGNGLSIVVQKDMMGAPQSVMSATVAEMASSYPVSFGDLFSQELGSFVSVVQGILSQSGRDAASRKSDVMTALDAFGSFISMGLDAVGKEAVKILKPSFMTEGGGEMELFKTKEEFVAGVKEILDPVVKELSEKLKVGAPQEIGIAKAVEIIQKAVDSRSLSAADLSMINAMIASVQAMLEEESGHHLGDKADKGKVNPALEAISKSIKDLAEKVEKVEKMGQQLEGDPAARAVEDPADPDGKKETKSVFKGVFQFRKRAEA